jgi:hypothetical protein
MIAAAVVMALRADEHAAMRESGLEVTARFENLDCETSGGSVGREQRSSTSCRIDVEIDLPNGTTHRQRAPIPYDLAYCASGPDFHMGTTFPVYLDPAEPEKFVYAENPCAVPSSFTSLWLILGGVFVAGLGLLYARLTGDRRR